ncbi:hypothetical protein ABZY09_39345 [Streptomyces sp. NPDC002928]|uniref:hypothetical protein n=1 Tax=Streptomyces sp. NPDC002928 TaxID=3154440 RepID=UPI00339E85D2
MEQVPGLTRRYGRVTERLRWAMSEIGLALAGRAGVRLAQVMGIATSRTTLLRRVMDLPDPAATRPRAIGVDDFALRRGHVREGYAAGIETVSRQRGEQGLVISSHAADITVSDRLTELAPDPERHRSQ